MNGLPGMWMRGLLFCCLCLSLFGAAGAMPAAAFEFSATIAAGYDDNPALTGQRTAAAKPLVDEAAIDGAVFARLAVELVHSLSLGDGFVLDGLAALTVTGYDGEGGRQDGGLTVSLSRPLAGGLVVPAVLAGASWYRDELVPDQDVDEVWGGGEVAWRGWARADVTADLSFHRLSYDGRGGHPGRRQAWSRGRGPMHLELPDPGARDDMLFDTGVTVDLFLLPRLDGRLGLRYAELDADCDIDTYRQCAGVAGISVRAPRDWTLDLSLRCFFTRYPDRDPELSDDLVTWSIHAGAERPWGPVSLFVTGDWREYESSTDLETDSRLLTEAGVRWSF